MHILFLSPEVWPFRRVGGLAEVSHDLPIAMGEMGHRVSIITPKSGLSEDAQKKIEPLGIKLEVPISWDSFEAELFKAELAPGATAYLVGHDRLFDREGVYGNSFGDYEDNAERFVFLCRAALLAAEALGHEVDILHANDWGAGLAPLYLKHFYKNHPLLGRTGSLMTVHNLGAQGAFWHYDMHLTGLDWNYFTPDRIEFNGKINFLKAGLIYADMVSTVSNGYLREIRTPEGGFGLDGVLDSLGDRLVSVVNGIDYREWNPINDKRLAGHFDHNNLNGRENCRKALYEELRLGQHPDKPLLAYVGRLLDRRGMDILAASVEKIMDIGFNLVFMGFGEDHYHTSLAKIARKRPRELSVKVGYDMDMAHRIMSGADMMIMPSRYEPCGLHQLHAMRYGCIPIVRATGGLGDTVKDVDEDPAGFGFKFSEYSSQALISAVKRAKSAFEDHRNWQSLIKRAMKMNYSWHRSAAQYLKIYQRAREMRMAGMES